MDDLSDLITRIVETDTLRGFEVVNASSGSGCSLLHLVTMIQDVTGQPLGLRFQPGRTVDAKRIVPSSRHTELAFGWQAKTPLSDGRSNAWTWYLKHVPA